ncbi:putative cytochrome P450 [Hypoxylon trugodes]|uniref:putative cytochrome P450 n=1 Tax=Hypoxylon trugodes TaxID=326681 RepID=UPI0021945516|nr:putative cytochrome P450 [Hypoxylon trugodes]KAI1391585.1 putative cytochrome P450 [Hypoxylon trugodes]
MAINLHFADPDTIHNIVNRRGDFQRPTKELKLLELYGPCISTAKWDDWPRHRKVMATPFNETIMKFVWEESVRQTKGMVQLWASASTTGVASYQKDTRTLSLNVLAATGFRKLYDFRGSTEPIIDEIGSYRDSLQTVLDNIILLMLVPFRVLCMMPGNWARIGNAGIVFKQHMAKMLDDEITALNQGKSGSGGIMSTFVRAADMHRADHENSKKGLSIDEIFGNPFVINFAGHDTTANTLAFAMLLLAAYLEVQDWLAAESATVTRGQPVEACDYKEIFPRLERCRAVIYETLRLYPPVPALPSIASNGTQKLDVGDGTLCIPEGTNLTVNLRAMQVHPQYWSDGVAWRPSRWILGPAPADSPTAEQLSKEQFFVPSKQIFFPWGEGPQICPGKKFAEVETVAVMAYLFKAHRLEVKKHTGETDSEVRKRIDDCLDDMDLEMLVRLRDAYRVTLICEEA